MAVFAREQTAGRGQMGRKWEAEKGANIALSIVIKPENFQLSQQFQLSACAAVSAHELLAKYAGDNTKIKWPNDLYWQDRKAGGILIESVVRSQESTVSGMGATSKWKWAIAGMGININQTLFPEWLPNPVSLKQITGEDFDLLMLAKELCGIFEKNINTVTREGFETIYQAYLNHLYKKNALVKFRKDNRLFEAVIKTVSPSGKLIVQHSIEEEFDFGEVEWIISK